MSVSTFLLSLPMTPSKAASLISNKLGINSVAVLLVSMSLSREGSWQALGRLRTDLNSAQDSGWSQMPRQSFSTRAIPSDWGRNILNMLKLSRRVEESQHPICPQSSFNICPLKCHKKRHLGSADSHSQHQGQGLGPEIGWKCGRRLAHSGSVAHGAVSELFPRQRILP